MIWIVVIGAVVWWLNGWYVVETCQEGQKGISRTRQYWMSWLAPLLAAYMALDALLHPERR